MAQVSNHPERRSVNDPCGETDSLISSNSTLIPAHDGSEKSRGELGAAKGSPIDRLPHELMVAAFDLYIGANTPVQDLVTLILVCKLWRNIVEGTPSLWRRISGREGLSAVRKALAMARDVPLEIAYSDDIAPMNIKTFFAEMDDRIARWKSLVVEVTDASFDSPLAALKTTAAPRLQTLHLIGPWDQEWEGGAVTLFGGEPAAQALKDLSLDYVQVIVAPLRLSGLRSLELNRLPIISAEELLRVIKDSPALEELALHRLVSLKDFVVPEHEGGLGAQSRSTGANHPAIQLLHLHHLSLLGLPVSFTHFLLSVIRPPNLRSIGLECKIHKSPASDLLTTDLSHLAPALKRLTATAEEIEINSLGESSWTFYVGNLKIGFDGLTVKPKHVEETLDWVSGHSGGHVKDLPASLITHEFDARSDLILWLGATLKVTYLELWTGSWSGHQERSQPRKIISLLSHPLAANQWALPALESVKTNVVDELGKSEILEMVKVRHSFIREQEEQKGGGDIRLRQFKELRLWGGWNSVGKDQAANVKFLTALEEVGRGAEIWWEEVKWTGSKTYESTVDDMFQNGTVDS
ncbi:hypothetical protein FRC04_000530 [Tulasnella sp. 424]|nr:hypothetical protein FRC04_000530 [Tulasnella sp. 424]KAG8964402.1 hypothetical protein FRC05_003826 [Tulasnella sp. 425]